MTWTSRRSAQTLLTTVACAALMAGSALVAAPASAGSSESRARFIVTVADGVDSRTVARDHRRSGAQVDFVYTAALNGFAGAMSQADLGELQRDRRVTRIERDGIATANEATSPQANPTWGLDRIDARSGLDKSYSFTATGAGVTAYIIDTGIRLSHKDFGARAASGFDAVDGGSADDCNGHGTHVAGTVGGTTYGVAKSVSLVAVRVLNCAGSGTWSGVIAGMDWVTANHAQGAPAVANMSLGGGASSSVDDAVRGMHNDGVTVVVAAGNGNRAGKEQDACNYSPARVAEAVTVGATTQTDVKTSWSNYGSCVDLFAPGAAITSAWHTGDSATNTISGTSMAAPHVAGVAGLYLQGNTAASPTTVRNAVYDATTKGIITSSKTANNHLVYSKLTTEVVSNGTITGTVTAEGGSALAGAVVTADGVSDTTDTSGKYEIALPPGTYEVAASASGYTTKSVTGVGVTSGSATPLDIALASSDGGSDPVAGFTLGVTAYKVKGVQHADLTWSGATSTNVDVIRNGTKVATIGNGGSHTDNIGNKGGGSYIYKICEAGTSTCSNEVAATF